LPHSTCESVFVSIEAIKSVIKHEELVSHGAYVTWSAFPFPFNCSYAACAAEGVCLLERVEWP